jgi:hypothetical protein
MSVRSSTPSIEEEAGERRRRRRREAAEGLRETDPPGPARTNGHHPQPADEVLEAMRRICRAG